MKVAILVAMPIEQEILLGTGLEAPGVDLLYVCTGIGKANAARAATETILRDKPDIVINTGCAGGMGAGMHFMDTVVAERTAYHDVWCGEPNLRGQVQGQPLYYESDPGLVEFAHLAAARFEGRVHFGLGASGDQFYISREEDQRILDVLPEAISSDMESGAIAQTCLHYEIPFINIRSVSDTHGSDEEQQATYSDFWTEVRLHGFAFLKEFLRVLSKT